MRKGNDMVYDEYSDDILNAYAKMTGKAEGEMTEDPYYMGKCHRRSVTVPAARGIESP